eukprot:CAMPEP_0194229654 /NCGR_PEP_ID=MMETSP0156-20130528/44004_1 /TAXON_ID=33649 /ORGANISM="Thalassionema nitzschioides, Strain L26-B" /LENGTH=57 /DNA_ID=CAMNT_0038962211 /DNA_START=393 /DNA_END=566 /DNA_ORIENTATION=-
MLMSSMVGAGLAVGEVGSIEGAAEGTKLGISDAFTVGAGVGKVTARMPFSPAWNCMS